MVRPDTEPFLRAVLDSVADHIAVLDSDGTILIVNQSWRQFGEANGLDARTAGEGVNYLAVCDAVVGNHASLAHEAAAGIRRVIAGQCESAKFEYSCHSPSEQRWFAGTATPLRVGGFTGAVVAHRNVTAEREAELRERENEEKYQLLVEHADEVFYSVLLDAASRRGQVLFMSQSVQRLTGLPVSAFIEQPGLWASLVHTVDRPVVMRSVVHCLSKRQPVSCTYRVRRPDGSYGWIEDRMLPMVDPEGRAIGLRGVVRDITSSRAAEVRLRDSQRALALAQATAHLGDWRIRPRGDVHWSDEMFRLHHLDLDAEASAGPPAPNVGRLLDLIHPADRDHVRAAGRTLLSKKPPHVTFLYRTNPEIGDERVLEAQAYTVTDEHGDAVEWHGTVLDVTEREQRSAELRQHQKMQSVGRLAGGIAHDFNNILSEIIGFAGFVRNALDEDDPRRADILCVLDAADRAAALTRQLLEFSRQKPSAPKPTDLNQRLDSFSPLLTRTVGEHINLSIEPSARPAVVMIDSVRFDQVVLNLVSNARDAMPGGGTLRLSVDRDDVSAYVRVTDTGSGMDAATQLRIFDPFFTTKPVGHGTGLGLATCFGIIEEAGGTIAVESAVGRGSTFLIALPLSTAPSHADDAPGPPVSVPANAEVLLCEDEAGLRRVGARTLEAAGYRVHVAADGIEAIMRIDELGPRLAAIVSDVVMPGRSGDDVAAYAARVIPGVPVLLTSGYFDHTHGLSSRTSEILWKPVPPSALVRAVAAAITSRQK